MDRTVEELLRYLSVVQVAFPRFPKHDVEVAGQTVSKGDVVICQTRRRQPRRAHRRGLEAFDPRGPPPRTWPSGTASTAASAPSWPGWSCGRRSPPWPDGSPTWPLDADALDYRQMSIVYGLESLPVRLHREPALG